MSVDTTREKAIAKAVADGMTVVESHDRVLLLDIDTEAELELCRQLLAMCKTYLDFTHATVTRSKSNKWHVHVHLKTPRPLPERILLQARLGSDRKREVLNFLADGRCKECLLFVPAAAMHEHFAGRL